MGLLGNLFGNKNKDEFTLGKTPEWFTSTAGVEYFSKLRNKDKRFLKQLNKVNRTNRSFANHMSNFFEAYLFSLPNIVEAKGTGPMVFGVSYLFVLMALDQHKDELGETHFTYGLVEDILNPDPEKNPCLYYIKHVTFGIDRLNIYTIMSAILDKKVNVVTDEWLYDPAIFDNADEKVVSEHIKAKLSESKNS